MRHIKLICFGKRKEPYLRQACAEYEKRLGATCKLEIFELSPAYLPDEPSPALIERALAQEALLAQAKLSKDAALAALCVEGRQMSSEQFAAWMESRNEISMREIAFVIGSSFGLHESIKKQAQLSLSLSAMTLPHQLARVVLLEQLYRASQIQSGGKYHK